MNENLILQIFCLDESANVESTTNYAPENSDDNSNDGKFSAKMVQNPEETYQREIDILQKLFPQKDKVRYRRFRCVRYSSLKYVLIEVFTSECVGWDAAAKQRSLSVNYSATPWWGVSQAVPAPVLVPAPAPPLPPVPQPQGTRLTCPALPLQSELLILHWRGGGRSSVTEVYPVSLQQVSTTVDLHWQLTVKSHLTTGTAPASWVLPTVAPFSRTSPSSRFPSTSPWAPATPRVTPPSWRGLTARRPRSLTLLRHQLSWREMSSAENRSCN